jgi:hypothetical protein
MFYVQQTHFAYYLACREKMSNQIVNQKSQGGSQECKSVLLGPTLAFLNPSKKHYNAIVGSKCDVSPMI